VYKYRALGYISVKIKLRQCHKHNVAVIFVRPSLIWDRIKYCTPSVCPSVPCLRFSRNREAV